MSDQQQYHQRKVSLENVVEMTHSVWSNN